MKALCTSRSGSQFSTLGSGGMARLLAAGALAASALTACGGSDDKGDQESGRGSLQEGGAGTGAGGTGSGAVAADDDTPDCDVDGSSIRRLSPSPDEFVGTILSVEGSIIFATTSGLYRVRTDGTSAPEKLLDGPVRSFFANGSQISALQVEGGSLQLRSVPSAGGAATSVALPGATDVAWSYDKAQNALFGVTSRLPLTYSRYDLSSGQTQEFATDLRLRANDATAFAPSAVLVFIDGDTDADVTQLYRMDKGTTTRLRLAPELMQKLKFAEADADNVYVSGVLTDAGPASHYSVSVDGSSPAKRLEFRGRVENQNVYVTEQGVFGQDSFGGAGRLVSVVAGAVGETLFEYSCETFIGLAADENDIYMVANSSKESWLLTVPRP